MAHAVLIQCVNMDHHDTQSSRASNDEAVRGAEFLRVSTFLKPQFRIAVAPSSGELQVKVELRLSEARVRLSARH